MRINRLAAVAAIATLTVGLAACGDNDDKKSSGSTKDFPAGSTMARLNKAQSIKIGTKFDQPGFGLKGLDGKPTGFDVSIATDIAAELGIPADKITWVETQSAVREEVIEQGKVDMVVATYTINPKRKERIAFAGPYYTAGQAIMVRSDETGITTPESLKTSGKKVCSVQGSTPAANIEKYLANKATQLVLFDVYSKCVDALKGKQVDAVTTDNVILLGFIANSNGAYKLAGPTFTQEPYGIGVKKDDTAFRGFINDTLTKMATDGRYAAAWKDTAGKFDPSTPTAPAVDRY